jgi:hypothetical protein
MRDVDEVMPELQRQRLIQPELVAEHGHVFGSCTTSFSRHHGSRVARRKMDQEEIEDGDAQQHRNRQSQPSGDIGETSHQTIPSEHDLLANAFRVCREGKPAALFRIML